MMVIYLDDYRKAKAARALAVQERYPEDLLCVNGGPIAAVSAMFAYRHPHELSPSLPDDLDSIDLDAFVDRVHAFASQV